MEDCLTSLNAGRKGEKEKRRKMMRLSMQKARHQSNLELHFSFIAEVNENDVLQLASSLPQLGS
jgi:hypothetical protein